MTFLSVVVSSLLLSPAISFAPSSFISSPYSSTSSKATTILSSSVGLSGEYALTPEGYGFSATAERVIEQAKRGNNGYYKATGNDKVIDVMGGITSGPEDVALVYSGSELLGMFTDSDYIAVSGCFVSSS